VGCIGGKVLCAAVVSSGYSSGIKGALRAVTRLGDIAVGSGYEICLTVTIAVRKCCYLLTVVQICCFTPPLARHV